MLPSYLTKAKTGLRTIVSLNCTNSIDIYEITKIEFGIHSNLPSNHSRVQKNGVVARQVAMDTVVKWLVWIPTFLSSGVVAMGTNFI